MRGLQPKMFQRRRRSARPWQDPGAFTALCPSAFLHLIKVNQIDRHRLACINSWRFNERRPVKFICSCLLCLVLLAIGAQAREGVPVERFAGTWSGRYTCDGQQVGVTYVLSKESRSAVAGTFSFYPVDGGQDFPAGSHHVRFRIEGDELTGGYGRWIQQPERRQKQKSANGRILSDTRLELQFEGSTCPPFSVEKFLGPAENAPRVVEKQQPKPKPVPAELTGNRRPPARARLSDAGKGRERA